MILGRNDRMNAAGHVVPRRGSSCRAFLFLWPVAKASAQAPAGPLPAHDQTDVDALPRAQASSSGPARQKDGAATKIVGIWKLRIA